MTVIMQFLLAFLAYSVFVVPVYLVALAVEHLTRGQGIVEKEPTDSTRAIVDNFYRG